MHDVMEPPICRSFTLTNCEISDTPPGKRDKKRMFGGADDKTSSNTSKTWSKMSETGSPVVNNAQKSVEHSRSGTQDDRARIFDSLQVLTGGELTKLYPSTSSLLGKEESSNKRTLDDASICFCASYAGRSIGKKKTEEMIHYAIQNLSEAGKALTNLGDNFEHDLKLMFMDIMGRVQHWVTVVENRIHAASADLESFKKESIARVSDQAAKDLELIALRRKLDEAEASLAAERKKRLENIPDQGQVSPTERTSTSMQTVTDKDRTEGVDKLPSQSDVTFINTGCQCENDREEGTNREAELEEELARLLEENERMFKEHAEYESAIHCALLKGVSSLNIEALKVLRHPPIPCCAPCRLSSPISSSLDQPVVACRPMTKRCDAAAPQPVQRGSNAASKNEKNDKTKSKIGVTKTNCCQPLSEHLLYCSAGSNERPRDNSMLFLLHHGDAGNQCQPCVQARCRPNGIPSNKGSVCVGGKNKKSVAQSTKEKVSCATRSSGSRPATYDLCVRNRDDTLGENGAAKKNTTIAKRCGVCSGNRCNRDD